MVGVKVAQKASHGSEIIDKYATREKEKSEDLAAIAGSSISGSARKRTDEAGSIIGAVLSFRASFSPFTTR
jgi:hypothetical protein